MWGKCKLFSSSSGRQSDIEVNLGYCCCWSPLDLGVCGQISSFIWTLGKDWWPISCSRFSIGSLSRLFDKRSVASIFTRVLPSSIKCLLNSLGVVRSSDFRIPLFSAAAKGVQSSCSCLTV